MAVLCSRFAWCIAICTHLITISALESIYQYDRILAMLYLWQAISLFFMSIFFIITLTHYIELRDPRTTSYCYFALCIQLYFSNLFSHSGRPLLTCIISIIYWVILTFFLVQILALNYRTVSHESASFRVAGRVRLVRRGLDDSIGHWARFIRRRLGSAVIRVINKSLLLRRRLNDCRFVATPWASEEEAVNKSNGQRQKYDGHDWTDDGTGGHDPLPAWRWKAIRISSKRTAYTLVFDKVYKNSSNMKNKLLTSSALSASP